MGDDFTLILVRGFPSLSEVRLYDETADHITAQHPEFRMQLPSQRTALEDAIANPTAVHASVTDPKSSVVIVSDSFTYFDDSVVVPVKLLAGTSGRVKTAYFSSDPQRGKVLWSATNE